jgi:signal transduction histidine kinase/ActR/RegA family two-component response regulator
MKNQLKPEVLGQLLLMQSIVGSLPNQETILSFVCKGMLDVPGISSAEYSKEEGLTSNDRIVCFPIQGSDGLDGNLILTLADKSAFAPYQDYVDNFMFMLSIILDERKQRLINEAHKKELELRVEERTLALQKEIEERSKAEEQLRQAHKMEAIGTLAGGIAHDFNNILAAIIGYADLAYEDIPDFNPAKNSIEQVQHAALRAKDIVQQILSFSRKQPQKLVPLDLASSVSSTLKFLRASIPSTVDIRTNFSPDCGLIQGDSGQINQILINFCTNAAQAMDETGGTLTIDLRNIDVDGDKSNEEQKLPPDSYTVLSVSDTGVGIEEKHLKRIFDPYYTTKDVGQGSGMGLAVVHGLVKSHNGILHVESTVSQGSTFKVYFPRIDSDLEKNVNKDQVSIPFGSEQLLVVDDEQSLLDIMERSLKKLGYRVDATTSSKKALELFKANPDEYDLVITDQTMPELTGEGLCSEILCIRADMPIIMCTGYSAKMDSKKAKEIGITSFLMKPASRNELAKAIRESIDAKRTLSSNPDPS